ncbi:MAG: acyl-CoA/acyl-ACP dehydrogenase [Dehalococcoidia bacterium]|nr:acyl-CoA/acyl-ACP dehydrogenase [Dehalococcoidia bacterium]
MDYALTEQQEMLRKTSRDFLEKECPKALVREAEDDEKGYSPDLWKKMAGLGWMGLVFPEEFGGSGLSYLDLTILLEEMGRALVPGPFITTICGGLAIQDWGSMQQKKKFLPAIARGELKLTLALMESGATYDPADIAVAAATEGDEYIVNGAKMFVPDAHISDYMLCAVRTKNSARKENGITLFLIKTRSAGIKVNLLKTFAADRLCEVVFKNARFPEAGLIGKLNGGWKVVNDILEKSAFATCPWMVGGAQQVLEASVTYAKERVQFDRPIGSFQAIQHKLANVAIDVAGARDITYQTAWKLTTGVLCRQDISIAKAWTGEAYRKACAEAIQVHGGVGITRDYDIQLYYRRAKSAELAYGDADYHLEMVARTMEL